MKEFGILIFALLWYGAIVATWVAWMYVIFHFVTKYW